MNYQFLESREKCVGEVGDKVGIICDEDDIINIDAYVNAFFEIYATIHFRLLELECGDDKVGEKLVEELARLDESIDGFV